MYQEREVQLAILRSYLLGTLLVEKLLRFTASQLASQLELELCHSQLALQFAQSHIQLPSNRSQLAIVLLTPKIFSALQATTEIQNKKKVLNTCNYCTFSGALKPSRWSGSHFHNGLSFPISGKLLKFSRFWWNTPHFLPLMPRTVRTGHQPRHHSRVA